MRKVTRRDFVKQTSCLTLGLAVSNVFADREGSVMESDEIKVTIPMPIQIVIDDVGWWSGEDGSKRQEPFRTGINRNHVPSDYQAIVDLGKALNIRPQAAMVLCEWDKENILRDLPSSTWMGTKWNNEKWIGPWLEEAAEIILTNKQHFEFTIHGIGHEYWSDGKFTRAEWADKTGVMRDREQVEAHLDFYEKLMNQHDFGSFPTSFVPTAFLHGFGLTEGHTVSMAEVLKKRGVKYINTPFEDMSHVDRVTHGVFGFDADVITVDRGHDLLSWKSIGELPEGELIGPTCGLHWPNLLHSDPERNSDIVEGWVKFLKPYNNGLETLLARNSDLFCHQLVHHICTTLKFMDDHIDIDFSAVDKLLSPIGQKNLTLKIESSSELMFEPEDIIAESKSVNNDGKNLIYTLKLIRIPGKKKASVSYRNKSR